MVRPELDHGPPGFRQARLTAPSQNPWSPNALRLWPRHDPPRIRSRLARITPALPLGLLVGRDSPMNRRDFYRIGTIALSNAVALVLAVPGIAYLFDPLRKSSKSGDFQRLAKLSDLTEGRPQS